MSVIPETSEIAHLEAHITKHLCLLAEAIQVTISALPMTGSGSMPCCSALIG